jgi:hypothetical protein
MSLDQASYGPEPEKPRMPTENENATRIARVAFSF